MATENDDIEIPDPSQKKSKVLPIALALNLLGTGAVAARVYSPPEPIIVTTPSADTATAAPGNTPGPVHQLAPLTVNLNEMEGTRYLKTTVELEFVNDDALSGMLAIENIIRNELLSLLSGLSFKETIGEEARLLIQKKIADRVNNELGVESVKRVLFAEFVVQ